MALVVGLAGRAEAQSGLRSLFAPSAPATDPGSRSGLGSSLADPSAPRPPLGIVPRPGSLPAAESAPASPAPGSEARLAPSAMGQLALAARYGAEAPPIRANLHWRVFADQPDASGQYRVIKEERGPNPVFVLPPGAYVVHVSLGLAHTARRLLVGTEAAREIFDLPVGGVRFNGQVGSQRIPANQLRFEIYSGSQFDAGEKRPLASDIAADQVVLLPEGIYHVVSTYGDGNAVMRYDLRVSATKLTDARISHRAAMITLKLVSEFGGEAIANTAWSVLTPGGDVIKESIGAFPTVVLAEGEYVALARNDGRIFNREFRVETGLDREVEVLSR